jgi:hypothetical protein
MLRSAVTSFQHIWEKCSWAGEKKICVSSPRTSHGGHFSLTEIRRGEVLSLFSMWFFFLSALHRCDFGSACYSMFYAVVTSLLIFCQQQRNVILDSILSRACTEHVTLTSFLVPLL